MLRALFLIGALLVAAPAMAALNHFWEGDGPDPNFSTQDNWLNDYYPLNNGSGYLRFGYSAETSPVVDAAWDIAGLNFSEAIGSFSLSGQPLSIGDLGIEVDGFANFYAQSIANDILLTANQTWYAQTNPVTVTGDISLQNRVLSITGAKGVTLAGNLNLGFVDIQPGGRLTLSGTVSCDVDNLGGTLVVATDQPQFPGSNLQFSGTSTLGATGNRNTGVSLDTSGELTFVGPGVMAAANGIRGAGSLVMDASATGSTLALGGGYLFPFAGAVNIKAGRLEMQGAQPGVPALTGPITVGDGVGPADEAVLELATAGIVQTNFGWIPQIASDGALVLGGDHSVTEFTLTGGRFSCDGIFQTEIISTFASTRTARIEGIWATPIAGGLDAVEVADGAADPDLRLLGAKRGPGGLLIDGPGHVEMSGPANSLSGRLQVRNATVTLARDTGPEPMNLDSFAATDSDIFCTAGFQLGDDCDVSLTRSGFAAGDGLTHRLHELSLDAATVGSPLGELRLLAPLDVLSTSTIEANIRFMSPAAVITIALGDTLIGGNFYGSTIDVNGQGYLICDSMSGQVNVWDGSLISAGAFNNLFVQSHLNVPVDTGDGVLNVGSSLTLHEDSDVTLTLRDTTEYSRIEVNAGLSGSGVANLDGYLEVALALDVNVTPGDEFVLVRAGTINGAFDTVVVEYTPEPGQTWTVYSVTNGFEDELRLRLDGVSDVGDMPPGVVTELALQVSPNPFNPSTSLRFDLPVAGPARIDVVDLRGRIVARLVDTDLPSGRHAVAFNGRDQSGQALPSGVYFMRLQAASGNLVQKVMLVK